MKKRTRKEEIKLLAAVERAMDAGEVTFVILLGERLAMPKNILDDHGVDPGQTVNRYIADELMLAGMLFFQAEIAARKFENDI